jgi:hypothetical protein
VAHETETDPRAASWSGGALLKRFIMGEEGQNLPVTMAVLKLSAMALFPQVSRRLVDTTMGITMLSERVSGYIRTQHGQRRRAGKGRV